MVLTLNGVIVPTITFFNENFEINAEINSLLIRHALLNDVNGIFLFGITGEGRHFSERFEEKVKLIDLALDITKNDVPILVGIYGNEENEVINQLETLGNKYDSINFVITPPFAEKRPIADLKSYFETIIGSGSYKNQVYLYNNPKVFAGNAIDYTIVHWLLSFPKLAGINDSSEKINNYQKYIQLISEEFGVYCGRERNFSTFLQLVPKDKRKYVGLFPSISNLGNLCTKLYLASVEEDPLKIIQIQEELTDFRKKIYDIQQEIGKQQRGLKYAFSYLYNELFINLNDYLVTSPEYQRDLEKVTQERIKATINFLVNHDYIKKYYAIGKDLYSFKDLNEKLSNIDELKQFGTIKKIRGPYEGKINTIYRLKIDYFDLVLRVRASKAFRYENLVKEKLLFPFLDNTLSMDAPDIREKVKRIISAKKGSYIFDKERPPIIPVGELIYFDETKEKFPYIYTLQQFIKGQNLHDLFEKHSMEEITLNKSKFVNLFIKLGEILGKLHEIKFKSFRESITDIGRKSKINWLILFQSLLDKEIQYARKNKIEFIKEIKDYFKDNIALIEEEDEPVLFHNDFHSHNLIVKDGPLKIKVKALIDFDNWRIGVRAQDFAKMTYHTLKPLYNSEFNKAFYQGYEKLGAKINKEFEKKIEIYSVLWLLKEYNSKMRYSEQKVPLDPRFPLPNTYLDDIKKILTI